ncbi:cytochrome c [Hyalangium sp.]|uniref:c-type cytochrome n=1 Tax=Hyalangium sp. TaxID=2028555 RepID=UPI002D2C38C7|nr:cytochrome c [Hyalangium sp.]HYH96189.1 cytochrome c [Hyalangium sp.]
MPDVLLLLWLVGGGTAPPRYDIGRVARPEEIQASDISVLPTGAGLPPGHGTAREGKSLYATLCATCHGANGEGRDSYAALVGGRGSLKDEEPRLTVGSYWPFATTIWDYIHRAMPYVAPGTLTPDQVYALTAFLLHADGIIGEDTVMNERTLPLVKMPNRDGFVADPRPDTGPKKNPPR